MDEALVVNPMFEWVARAARQIADSHDVQPRPDGALDQAAIGAIIRRNCPHLHDVNRTQMCWCGADPDQPHEI